MLRRVVSPGDNTGRNSCEPPLSVLAGVLLRLDLGELEGRGASKHRAKSVRERQRTNISVHNAYAVEISRQCVLRLSTKQPTFCLSLGS